MKTRALAFRAMLLFASAMPAFADDLKMTTVDVAPWASQDPATHQAVGFFPAVVREIERRTGLKIQLTLHPFVRIDHDMESGEQDCTTIVWNDYRAPFVEKGELVSTHVLGVIARRGVVLKNYADLRPLTISVIRGLRYQPPFETDSGLKKERDADYMTGLKKIAHHRLDAISGALATIHYLARHEGMDQDLGDEYVLGEVPLLLQCSKRSKKLPAMPQLNEAIKSMREDGTIDRLKKENYFS